jgi:hypothetical protein
VSESVEVELTEFDALVVAVTVYDIVASDDTDGVVDTVDDVDTEFEELALVVTV